MSIKRAEFNRWFPFERLKLFINTTKDINLLKNIMLEVLDNEEWETSWDTWKEEITKDLES